MQYFLVPDIEVENGAEDDEEDLEEEEDVDESVCLYFLVKVSKRLMHSCIKVYVGEEGRIVNLYPLF